MKVTNPSPLVSVIVPVYNSEKYLEACIDSILEQSLKNIEIIFINDGSTDKSLNILKSKNDSRVIILSQKNSGASEARNAGLKIARGDYICFVDSDDIIGERYIEMLLKSAQQTNADIVCAGYIQITNSCPKTADKPNNLKCLSKGESIERLLTERISSAPHSKLFKHKTIKDIAFPKLSIAEDLLFNYQAMRNAKIITLSSCALYYYRSNMLSLTKKRFEPSRMDGLTAVKEIMESEGHSAPSIIRAFMEAHYILESMVKQKNFKRFKKQCFDIIRYYRFYVLSAKEATTKQRIFAALSILSPALPSRIVLIKRRKK